VKHGFTAVLQEGQEFLGPHRSIPCAVVLEPIQQTDQVVSDGQRALSRRCQLALAQGPVALGPCRVYLAAHLVIQLRSVRR
jgi:hypothetical protein